MKVNIYNNNNNNELTLGRVAPKDYKNMHISI